mgnify:CR=1 FL=1
MIFWSLILIVTVKYVVFVLRADNNGEGGVLSLMALALRSARAGNKSYTLLLMLGALGIADIAFTLDYASLSSFVHAFRRWSGMSPGRWREERGGVSSPAKEAGEELRSPDSRTLPPAR